MIAYWVRWENDTEDDAMLVVARNLKELYWQVDAVGDPTGAIFFKITDRAFLANNLENDAPMHDEKRWKRLEFPPLTELIT